MRRKIILLFLLISTLAACSMDKNEVKDSPLYEGRDLTIGVVGKIPDVRERNIVFKSIDLNDIRKGNLSSKYDAIFIMKEHLIEAARAPYAKIYKNYGIPFFFIESKKSHVPFIEAEIEYEAFPDTDSGEYASGYYHLSNDTEKSWGYGLYNDTVNEVNILNVFSRIFMTIKTIDQ